MRQTGLASGGRHNENSHYGVSEGHGNLGHITRGFWVEIAAYIILKLIKALRWIYYFYAGLGDLKMLICSIGQILGI